MSEPELIPLYSRLGVVAFAIVDAADLSLVQGYRWGVLRTHGGIYADFRRSGRPHLLMHRLILGVSDGTQVDHINRDSLDNRRQNLRAVTHAQNMQNRRVHRGSLSRYRGVYLDVERQMWCAQVRVDGRKAYFQRFRDEESAALAAAAARQRLMTHAID